VVVFGGRLGKGEKIKMELNEQQEILEIEQYWEGAFRLIILADRLGWFESHLGIISSQMVRLGLRLAEAVMEHGFGRVTLDLAQGTVRIQMGDPWVDLDVREFKIADVVSIATAIGKCESKIRLNPPVTDAEAAEFVSLLREYLE
jgi:hypothetical protein